MLDLSQLLALKDIPRAGWLRVGIENPESVAAHAWGMACLAAVLAPENLDLKKVLLICIAHDLPEIVTGDITPHDGISRTEKKRREQAAAHELLSDFPVLLSAWDEYEQNITNEARFVHQLDKLDMGLQAKRYSNIADTNEFLHSAMKALDKPFKTML